MKKNYYVPEIEVVAFVGGMLMDGASPVSSNPNPNDNDPSTGGDPI